MIDQADNTRFDQEGSHRNFVEECYRQGLAVSDISKITGVGWTEVGQIIQEGIDSGSLPKAEQHRKIWEQEQDIDLNTLALIQAVVAQINEESKEKRQMILRGLLSLLGVIMIGLGLAVLWNHRAQADVLGEVTNALKNHQWVKYEVNSGPFTGEIIWRGFSPEVFIRIRPNGEIFYITQNPDQGLLYDPKSGEIIALEDNGTQYLRQDITNLLEWIEYIAGQRFSESNQYRSYQDKEDDVIEFEKKSGMVTMRCDPLTHLPRSIVAPEFSCLFTYDQKVPQDIYALGVPRDAIITNLAR